MAGPRATLTLATVIALATGAAVVYAVMNTSTTISAQDGPRRGAYREVPTSWLVQGEMRFTRLSDPQAARVKVSASTAEHVAEAGYARNAGTRVVFESLGGFVDANQIVRDWVGTRSWIPPVRPAYFVRLAGVKIPTMGPQSGVSHHVDVIVSAITGREICAVSFD
jgi:hypothetical protein